MSEELPEKAVVSISDMARMVGLSRTRFHQLMKAGIFPQPLRDSPTSRLYYDQNLQTICLTVRQTNTGVNGKPILFYPRRRQEPVKSKKAQQGQHAELIDDLKSLGLAQVTAAQVQDAMQTLYPNGTSGVDELEVIRQVFLFIRRKNPGDSVQ
jgi:DNA-binding transcriptional MerR regulator